MVADVERVASRPGRGRGRRRRSTSCAAPPASDENVMPATIALARAGGTTGEWAGALREVFGEFRAPDRRARRPRGRRTDELAGGGRAGARTWPAARRGCSSPSPVSTATRTAPSRSPWRPATPGMEVVYSGIRLTPEQIAASARDEDPDVIGLSILSGSHLAARARGARPPAPPEGVDAPVVVGGIIPEDDRAELLAAGVAAVYTPKDFELGADHGRDHQLHRGASRRRLRPMAGPAGDRAQGAAVVVAAGGAAGGGTVRRWPAWILFGSVMPFAADEVGDRDRRASPRCSAACRPAARRRRAPVSSSGAVVVVTVGRGGNGVSRLGVAGPEPHPAATSRNGAATRDERSTSSGRDRSPGLPSVLQPSTAVCAASRERTRRPRGIRGAERPA